MYVERGMSVFAGNKTCRLYPIHGEGVKQAQASFEGIKRLRLPEGVHEGYGVAGDALRSEVFADSCDVALEDKGGIRIAAAVGDLGKVNQRDGALPVEDIVGRQIAVNHLQ